MAVVQPAQVEDTTEYVATLKAVQSTSVHPQVEGYVVRISMKSGQRVDRGALLLEVDQARQQASVDTQEASVSAREADLAYAQQQFQRQLLSEKTKASLTPEMRELLAIDDEENARLTLADPGRSGFLK